MAFGTDSRQRWQCRVLVVFVLLLGTCYRGWARWEFDRPLTERRVLSFDQSPYDFSRDVVIEAGGQLTIDAGVELRFAPGAGITVKGGALVAKGDPDRRITFTRLQSQVSWSQPDDGALRWPEVRLVDGDTPRDGRLQILYKGRWRSVCTNSKNWTATDVQVACRQLGFSGGVIYRWFDRSNDSSQFLYENPNCTEFDQSLTECDNWPDRQIGGGVCDYHQDLGILCDATLTSDSATYWRGLRFEDSHYTTTRRIVKNTLSKVSSSSLEYVDILYAGRDRDGNATSALESVGVPPRMRRLDVRWSAYTAINVSRPTDGFTIEDSVIAENRGGGVYINSSTGMATLRGLKIRDNGADGIRYVFHDTFTYNKDEFCYRSNLGSEQVYPVHLTYEQSREARVVLPCIQRFEVDDTYGQVLTVHFLTLLSDEGDFRKAGYIDVYDGWSESNRQLASLPVMNSTRPQSVTSSRSAITLKYRPPDEKTRVLFTVQVVASVGKAYDLNITDCAITGNNGRGVSVENQRSGTSLNHTVVTENTHVAGLHILGGSGDVILNNSAISNNVGDGVNVSFSGGFVHVDHSSITNNTLRGLAIWTNETVRWAAFNFSTQVGYSKISHNGFYGLFFGNMCREDSFLNISMNTFRGNDRNAIVVETCQQFSKAVLTFHLTHNKFLGGRRLALSLSPALNVIALIEHNFFTGYETGTLYIANRDLDHFTNVPASIDIQFNTFIGNRGVFVVNVGLLQGGSSQRIVFTKNRLEGNTIKEPFSALNPRSRVASVMTVSSDNVFVFRNYFNNPDSRYEFGSHLEDHGSVINASLNYWGTADVKKVYDRIFDRKDRYNLARVEFLKFITLPSDLSTTRAFSDFQERDKIIPFEDDNGRIIGGEVAGEIVLTKNEYFVRRDIFVHPGSKLTIPPGVVLRFEKSIGMMVQGYLGAESATFTMMGSTRSPLKSSSVRLSNGTEGKLEIRVGNEWGGVCMYGWDIKDAAVVCHQLGFVLHPQDWLLERSQFVHSERLGNIVLNNVQCTDLDTDITECEAEKHEDFEDSCTMEVGLRCYLPAWAGIRFGMAAEESSLRHVTIEKAGLLDYTTHVFQPALQLDFNRHLLDGLKIRDNTDSGLGIMWNDIYYGEPRKVTNSEISGNHVHGIETRSQGLEVIGCTIRDNIGSGFQYNPMFSMQEQRDLISWINRRDEGTLITLPDDLSSTDTITLPENGRKYLVFRSQPGFQRNFFIKTYIPGKKIGIMVINPFSASSTEQFSISSILAEGELVWDIRKNLTSFPMMTIGSRVSARYVAGRYPDGTAIIYLSVVDGKQISEKVPTTRILSSVIGGCRRGISTHHYNRDISQSGDHYHRYSNETLFLSGNDLSGNKEEAMLVWTPYWDPLVSSLAEVNYTLVSNRFTGNGRGIMQYNRDIRNSNNLFHWTLNGTIVQDNHGGGVNIRLPYVWQYSENYTHSVEVHNSTFTGNRNFEFHVGGHFARLRMTGNAFRNNFCKTGLVSITGMEKEMLVEENTMEDNSGEFVVEFSLESHADKFGVVDANFVRNRLKNNTDNKAFADSRAYEPDSYAIGVRGIQEVNITRNLIYNPYMKLELLAGVLTGSLENTINVAENWWGSSNVSKIQERIFDFDDWNGYAVADWSSYLAEDNFNSPAIPSEVQEKPLDLRFPLGGRVYKHVTLAARSSPYVVSSDLTIMPDVVMTIEPGVVMEFYPSVGILVLGDLRAIGQEFNPIIMRPARVPDIPRRVRRQAFEANVRLCITEQCNEARRDGFLEIYNTTTFQWVPICDSRFTERNAQVVCRELGYSVLNVHVKRGPRTDISVTQLSRIRSWPHPLECTGTEPSLTDCDFRLNGYMKEMYTCSSTDDFIYIYCGPDILEYNEEHWGGIRFSIPNFEDERRFHHPTVTYTDTASSELRYVQLTAAGILHGEKYTAIQSVFRKLVLDHVTVTRTASHGIQMVAVPENLYFNNLVIKKNLGVGLSILVLTGETSANTRLRLFYQPLREIDLPYDVFGMLAMCDTNKAMDVNRRVLLYYKYDNNPVDCVKIFSSPHQVGLRLLQFNLFNGTSFSAQPDILRIYDGDIFNSSTPLLGLVGVDTFTAGQPSDSVFYLSSGSTLSVQLHATGASGVYGFVAEVVTIPITNNIPRNLQHNISNSEFSNNYMEGLAYRSAGALTPRITFSYNRVEGNGRELFGNFTTTDSAVLFDIQNLPYLYFYNNILLGNQGGLHIHVDSLTSVTFLEGYVVNNLFVSNLNKEALLMRQKYLGSYQFINVFQNYFTRNSAQYHNTILFSRVLSNFTRNIARRNTGRHLLDVRGFDRRVASTQTCSYNSLTDNVASDLFERSTIMANNAGQRFTFNLLVNPDNDFEISAANRSMLLGREHTVDASHNWWGSNETSAISGRIRDSIDYPELLTVDYSRFQEDNSSLLSGKCAGGWEKIEDTCFVYIGGVMTYKEAKRFCEMENSSMPYVKGKRQKLMDFVESRKKYFDRYTDRIWIQSIDFLFNECVMLYNGRVLKHPCDNYLPFLCERDPDITVTTRYWYQDTLTIIALIVTCLAILLVGACLGCWLQKSRHRYQEKLERKNSIRASIRSNHSLTGFGELGYKRRLEKAFKAETAKVATLKLNGSVDSIDKAPSQFTCSLDDSHSYDTTAEARNHNVEYTDFVNRFTQDARMENATANMIAHPTFDLTYENQGYIDRSLSRASPGESRDWSTTTDSTLDMKRSLEGDSKDLTFQSTPSPRVSSRDSYGNNGGASSTSSSRRPPLETAM